MTNYFNQLSLREQLLQLGVCRFMDKNEFNIENITELIKIQRTAAWSDIANASSFQNFTKKP